MPHDDGVEDVVSCPRPVPGARIAEGFTRSLARLTLGVIRGRPDGFFVGPLPLIRLGPAEDAGPNAVRWPVSGGLLSRRPGGWVGFEWRAGRLRGYVRGWEPRLPRALYLTFQRPLHHTLTRLYLLGLRGRDPLPGPAPTAPRRLGGAAVDLGLCLLLSRRLGGRRGRFAIVAAAYHAAAWTAGGRTLGGVLTGQRLLSVDGSSVTLGQAVARLIALPLGPRMQDRVAGTALVSEVSDFGHPRRAGPEKPPK